MTRGRKLRQPGLTGALGEVGLEHAVGPVLGVAGLAEWLQPALARVDIVDRGGRIDDWSWRRTVCWRGCATALQRGCRWHPVLAGEFAASAIDIFGCGDRGDTDYAIAVHPQVRQGAVNVIRPLCIGAFMEPPAWEDARKLYFQDVRD